MTFYLDLLALLVSGLMVGVEFCVAVFVNPILNRLPIEAQLSSRSDGGRMLGRVMPFWYFATLVLTLLSAWKHGFDLRITSAAALWAVTIALSIIYLVPINNRVSSWTAANAPDDWRMQQRQWDRGHQLRVAVLTLGEILLLSGVLHLC
jgi:uncharacterized membrane protein